MKIVVTGAAGYIGTKLVERLLSLGHRVVCFDNLMFGQWDLVKHVFDNPKCVFYNEDITEWSDNLKSHIDSSDVVYPLAAIVGAPLCDKMVAQTLAVNQKWIESLTNLLVNQIVVFPNTNSGYGSTGDAVCTEETPSNPLSLYASTKQKAEDALINYYHRAVCFRLATVFGVSHRPRTDLLINNLVKESLSSGKIEVFDGHFRRNYMHIDDIVSALTWPISRIDDMKGKIFNLGNDSINMTKLDLVKRICSITGATYSLNDSKTDPDKRDYLVSSAKLYKVGFRPKVGLEDGVKELVEFYKNEYPKMDPNSCRNY